MSTTTTTASTGGTLKQIRIAIRVRTFETNTSLRFEGAFPLHTSLWEVVSNITPVGSSVPLTGFSTTKGGWMLPALTYKGTRYDTLGLLTSTSVRQLNIAAGSAVLDASFVPTGMTKEQAHEQAATLRAQYLERQASVMSEINARSPPASSPTTSSGAAAGYSNGGGSSPGATGGASPTGSGATMAPSGLKRSPSQQGSVRTLQLRPFRHSIAAIVPALEQLLDEILVHKVLRYREIAGTDRLAKEDLVQAVGEAVKEYQRVITALRNVFGSLLDTHKQAMVVPTTYSTNPVDPRGAFIAMAPNRARARMVLLPSNEAAELTVSVSQAHPASATVSAWDNALRLLCLAGFGLVDEDRPGAHPSLSPGQPEELTPFPHVSALLFVSSPRDAIIATDSIAQIAVKYGGRIAAVIAPGPGSIDGVTIFPHPAPAADAQEQAQVVAMAEEAKLTDKFMKLSRMVLVPELEDTELITRILQEVEDTDYRLPSLARETLEQRASMLLRDELAFRSAMNDVQAKVDGFVSAGMSVEEALKFASQEIEAATTARLERQRTAEALASAAMDYDINELRAAIEQLKAQTRAASDEQPLKRPVLCSALTSLSGMTQKVLAKLEAREPLRIDTSNQVFKNKLGRFPATFAIMKFIGFAPVPENPASYVCTPTEADRVRVSRAQTMLQAALQQATPSQSESQYADFLASREGAARIASGWDPKVFEPNVSTGRGPTSLPSPGGDEDTESMSDAALILSVLSNRRDTSLITPDGRFLSKAEAELLEQKQAKVYDTTILRIEFNDRHKVQFNFPPYAPFETVFDALDRILQPHVVQRQYGLSIGPMKLLTRDRGIIDPTKPESTWPPIRQDRSPYLSFADIKLVPAVNARIQWINRDYDVLELAANRCLKPEVFASRIPYQDVAVPKPVDSGPSATFGSGAAVAESKSGDSGARSGLSDADLDRLSEQMMAGRRTLNTAPSAVPPREANTNSSATSTKSKSKLLSWLGRK